jgi:hypothetical protein
MTLGERWDSMIDTISRPLHWDSDNELLNEVLHWARSNFSCFADRLVLLDGAHYIDALRPVFEPAVPLHVWRNGWSTWNLSLEDAGAFIMEQAYKSFLIEDPLEQGRDPLLWGILRSADAISAGFESFHEHFLEELQERTRGKVNFIQMIAISAIIAVIVLPTAVLVVILDMLHENKSCIFGAFRALPKVVLSQIVETLSVRMGTKSSDGMFAAEQNAMRTLTTSSGVRSGWLALGWPVAALYMLYVGVCAAALTTLEVFPASSLRRLIDVVTTLC